MNEKFTLTIDMGNDSMKSKYDVADALNALVQAIYNKTAWPDYATAENGYQYGGPIQDTNGNTVGSFEVTA